MFARLINWVRGGRGKQQSQAPSAMYLAYYPEGAGGGGGGGGGGGHSSAQLTRQMQTRDPASQPAASPAASAAVTVSVLNDDRQIIQSYLTKLQTSLEKWLALKQTLPVMLNDEQDQPVTDQPETAAASTSDEIKTILKACLEIIVQDVEPASWEIQGLLKKTQAHINFVHQRLNTLYQGLHDSAVADKNKLHHQICDYNILLINDMKEMMSEVFAEINYAEKRLKVIFDVVGKVVELLVLIATNMPAPGLSAELEESAPNLLAKTLTETMSAVEQFVSSWQDEFDQGLVMIAESVQHEHDAAKVHDQEVAAIQEAAAVPPPAAPPSSPTVPRSEADKSRYRASSPTLLREKMSHVQENQDDAEPDLSFSN